MKNNNLLAFGFLLALLMAGPGYAEQEYFILEWDYKPNTIINSIYADDLDGDGVNELIACSGDGIIYHLTKDGKTDWQKNMKGEITDYLTTDVNSDGKKEIIVGVKRIENSIMLMDYQGITYRGSIDFSPMVEAVGAEDLDGDGSKEIIVGCTNAKAYAIKMQASGDTRLWEYESKGSIKDLEVKDIDSDGKFETVFVSQWREGREILSEAYALTSEGALIWNHSIAGGISEIAEKPMILEDLDDDGTFETIIGTTGGVIAIGSGGDVLWEYSTEKPVKVVYSKKLTGTNKKTVLVGATPYLYALDANGDPLWSAPVETTIYDIHAADIDGNGADEIILGATKYVYLISESGRQIATWVYGVDKDEYKKKNVNTKAVYSADMDGDGVLEVLAGVGWTEPRLDSNYDSGDINVLEVNRNYLRITGSTEPEDEESTTTSRTEKTTQTKVTSTTRYFEGVQTVETDIKEADVEEEAEQAPKNPCIPFLPLMVALSISILLGIPFVFYTSIQVKKKE